MVMVLACEQDVVQADSGSIMVWNMLLLKFTRASSEGGVSVLMGMICHIFIYSNKI